MEKIDYGLSVALIKKHLRLFNKMIRAETYSNISKMTANEARLRFNQDFRQIAGSKDGKIYYVPRKNTIDIDGGYLFQDDFKELSKDLKINKPKEEKAKPKKKSQPKKAEPKKAEPKKAEPKKAEPKKAEPKKAEPKKTEPKKAEPKKAEVTLKKLVSLAISHKKNGISQEGLKLFNNSVLGFLRTKPPKNENKIASQLYNYLYRNTFLGTKYMPKGLNKQLKELGLRTL